MTESEKNKDAHLLSELDQLQKIMDGRDKSIGNTFKTFFAHDTKLKSTISDFVSKEGESLDPEIKNILKNGKPGDGLSNIEATYDGIAYARAEVLRREKFIGVIDEVEKKHNLGPNDVIDKDMLKEIQDGVAKAFKNDKSFNSDEVSVSVKGNALKLDVYANVLNPGKVGTEDDYAYLDVKPVAVKLANNIIAPNVGADHHSIRDMTEFDGVKPQLGFKAVQKQPIKR